MPFAGAAVVVVAGVVEHETWVQLANHPTIGAKSGRNVHKYLNTKMLLFLSLWNGVATYICVFI